MAKKTRTRTPWDHESRRAASRRTEAEVKAELSRVYKAARPDIVRLVDGKCDIPAGERVRVAAIRMGEIVNHLPPDSRTFKTALRARDYMISAYHSNASRCGR